MFYMVGGKVPVQYETGYKGFQFKVLEVVTTESASLEGMKAYVELGYKGVCRRIATANEFFEFSENGGENLTFQKV